MGDEAKLRVLLADDHALVREGLKRLIDDQPDMKVIGEASEGHTAVRLAQDLDPDVALVDLSMPGLNGEQVTRLIAETCPRVRVIALTRHNDDSFVRRLFDSGAAGYVLKQSASTELTRGIRSVTAGERYVDSSIRPVSTSPAAKLRPPSGRAKLTVEEERVLGMIAMGHSHQDIANTLSMELPRLRALLDTAMSKAGITTRGEVVLYAEARGWLGRGSGDGGTE